MNIISYERVRFLFNYDPISGILTRAVSLGKRSKIGSKVGFITKHGYLRTQVDGKFFFVHRIIYLWYYGYLPENGVDHEDRITYHNWIKNLRDISHSCNMKNRKVSSNNISGVTGVTWDTRRKIWQANITINDKFIHLGYFDDFKDAVISRYLKEAELKWNGCNSTSSAYLYLKDNSFLT